MTLRRSFRSLALCLGILLAAARLRADARHPYTIDDYLKLEDTGKATVDPTGRWLVYERMPAYDELPDYSVGRIGSWSEEGGRLMVVDLSEVRPQAKLLFEPDPKKTYWIDGFSPDGARFAFYAAERSHITVGVCEMSTRKVTGFEAAPRVDWLTGHKSIWLSPSVLVFAAMAEGDQPSSLSFRGHTGEKYAEAWRKSWEGKVPSVSVVESHADGGGHEFLGGRLIRADAVSGRMEILAQGQFEDLEASADGRYLAALRQADMTQPDPKRLSTDWISARSQLTLFDLAGGGTGTPRVIAPDQDVFPGTIAWASDADRLAFFGWKIGARVQSGIFQSLDAATGARTPYPHIGLDLASMRERGWYQRPERETWIGDRLAVFARAAERPDAAPTLTYRDIASRGATAPRKADWFLLGPSAQKENLTAKFEQVSGVPVSATAKELFVLADGAVWRLESGKPAVNLTPKVGTKLRFPGPPWGSPDAPPFQSFVTFESESGGKSVFTMLDLKSLKVSSVEAPAAGAHFLAASARTGAILFRENSDDGSTLLLSRSKGPPVSLDRLNTHLARVARMRWVSISYPAGPGQLASCALLPPDYQAGKRYPAIVEVYPGRVSACMDPTRRESYSIGSRPGSYSLDLLAAQGYVVLEASAPSGLIQTPDGPVAKLPEVVLLAVDALVAQGYADPNRIGLLGLSQGGFSSLWVTTQTDRFKATVSLNGWADLFSHYFQGPSEAYGRFYADEFHFASEAARYESTAGTDFPIGRTPWDDPMIYVRNSPVFQAPKVTTPIMMIHSDLDAFGLAQYDEMFAALYRLRKEAKFVRYWGEGHSPSSPANLRDMWGKIFAWYGQYLGK